MTDVENETKPTQPQLYGLVDVSGEKSSLVFLRVASEEQINLWHELFKLQDKPTKVFDSTFTTEQLQYLYWNTTKLAPSDDVETLSLACADLIEKLPVDVTSADELRARIDLFLADDIVEHQVDDAGEQSEVRAERASYTQYVNDCNSLHIAILSRKEWEKEGSLSLVDLRQKWFEITVNQDRKEGDPMATKKAGTKSAKPKAEKKHKAVKVPKEKKAKKPKAELAGLKVGDRFVGRFKGTDYEVSAVETSDGIQFKLKGGKTFTTKSAAAKALWEKLELPAEGLKTFRFRGPVAEQSA